MSRTRPIRAQHAWPRDCSLLEAYVYIQRIVPLLHTHTHTHKHTYSQQSAVVRELKGMEGRYENKPDTPKTNESDTYALADPQPLKHTDSAYVDVSPEHYENPNDQHSARIPSVVVERPKKSTDADLATAAAALSSRENGVYTPIERSLLNEDNVYTVATPVSHRSTTSLQNLVTDDKEYAIVDSSMSANYLNLGTSVSPDGERFRRSSSGGRSPPSPLLSPQLGEQIYENSQEVTPSGSPLLNGAYRRTSTDRMQPASPLSPPLLVPQDERQIYENSLEVMPLEDDEDEDDVYENDIPGIRQQAPNFDSYR